MPIVSRAFSANRILAQLSDEDCRKLGSHLEPVPLSLGEVLNEAGAPHEFAWFPVGCMISFVAITEGGNTLEVGLVGREGMVGVALALGIDQSPARAIVQCKGAAIRIPATAFSKLVAGNMKLRAAAHRYAYVSMATAILIAACNHQHSLEARMARWLLMSRDCLSTTTFETTQEFLGQMLGVRRPTVNAVATELQRRDLISYTRGKMHLIDLDGLSHTACSCYEKIRQLSVLTKKLTRPD